MPRPRGAKPSPRHVLASATPHRPSRATPAFFGVVPPQLSYWLNDQDGDCVTASEAFFLAAMSIWNGQTSEVFTPDAVVKQWAQAHGVLNGAVISDVLDWRVTDPFVVNGVSYYDGPKQSIDYTNQTAMWAANADGSIKIGVAAGQLENAVGTTNGWFATGFTADSNYDHCVELLGFGTIAQLYGILGMPVPSGATPGDPANLLGTWNTVGVIDWPSLQAIICEAWSRTSPQIVVPTPTPTPGPTPTPVIPPAPTPGPTPTPTPIGAGYSGTVTTIYMGGVVSNITATPASSSKP